MKRRKNSFLAVIFLVLLQFVPVPVKAAADGRMRCGQLQHKHTGACYSREGEIQCGYADYFLHNHSEICYLVDGNIRCTLRYLPSEESVLHTHSQVCFHNGLWICGQPELMEHGHAPACFSSGQERARQGSGTVQVTPYTMLGILQAAAALTLLYWQKLWPGILCRKEDSLPQP